MKVLIVARYTRNKFTPFVAEQVDALIKRGVDCKFFPVRSARGYLEELPALRKEIKAFQPDVVHAHYGLSSLFANLQRMVPVVTTYHGSDINEPLVLPFSKMAIWLSAFNIFVSQSIIDIVRPKKKYALVPCGISLEDYPLVEKIEARKEMGLKPEGKYVLFAGGYDKAVKNAALAKSVVAMLPGVELLELKGYSRHQVALMMQAVDSLILTSHTEGSPQVIKEALVCGTPIVSVDVGDVKERTNGVEGCFVAETRDPSELVSLLKLALAFKGRTAGRQRVIDCNLDNYHVTEEIIKIYNKVCGSSGHK